MAESAELAILSVSSEDKQDKFIWLTDLEGNPNYLISGNAHHSLAPLLSQPPLRGLRSNVDQTKTLVDANGDPIKVHQLLTYSNLDLGVGKKLKATFGLVGDKVYYRILGMEFVEANGLIVDFEKKTVTCPGPKGKTVTGKGLVPEIIEVLYPKNGVVNVKNNDKPAEPAAPPEQTTIVVQFADDDVGETSF